MATIGSNDWKHASLRAKDGTEIRADFKTQEVNTGNTKPLILTKAAPLWINVYDPAIKADSKVRVVLNDYGAWSSPNRPSEGKVVDLWVPEPGHATADLGPMVIHDTGYGGNHDHTQSLAVVVDGKWKENPYGGDFQLALDKL